MQAEHACVGAGCQLSMRAWERDASWPADVLQKVRCPSEVHSYTFNRNSRQPNSAWQAACMTQPA
eukprot:360826-Chlamydomonas_euryale.AAC.3